jgi:hypothetical protein
MDNLATVHHYLRLPNKPDQYTFLGSSTIDRTRLLDCILDHARVADFYDQPELRTDERGNASWVFTRDDGAMYASSFHVIINGYPWTAA